MSAVYRKAVFVNKGIKIAAKIIQSFAILERRGSVQPSADFG